MQPGTTRALTPTVTLLAPPGHNGNDSSLVASLRYAGHHLLLAGDLERRGEAWLAKQRLGRATLLKMPHHGSNTSSSPALLNAYQPTVAVASCGLHNRFNHPHPHVLKRYRDSGALILRTDLHGLLRVELTPNAPLRVRSQRPAGPYLLDLPQNSRHLWKTCYTPRPAEAPSPH
jgi:competence protein ComEC